MLINVRSSTHRTKKYSKKIRAFILPGQLQRKAASVKREVDLERMVEGMVGPSLVRGHYMIFAKQLNKLLGKYKGETLQTEACIKRDMWVSRGLDETTLDNIMARMNMPSCALPPPTCDNFILRPESNGTFTEFPFATGNHWDDVDEEVNDEDLTYIQTTTGGGMAKPPWVRDTFNVPDVTFDPLCVIDKVVLFFKCRGVNPLYPPGFYGVLYTYATLYQSTIKSPGLNYILYSHTWTNNPNTGNPWTIAELNNLEIGVRGRSGYLFVNPWVGYAYFEGRCTQVYLVVHISTP